MHHNLIGITASIMGIYFSLLVFVIGLVERNWQDVSLTVFGVVLFLNLTRWNYLQYQESTNDD